MRFKCGCELFKDNDKTIHFKTICENHKLNGKYIWLALQFENENT